MYAHQTTDQIYELAWCPPLEHPHSPQDRATRNLNQHVDLSELMTLTLSHMVRKDRSIFGE